MLGGAAFAARTARAVYAGRSVRLLSQSVRVAASSGKPEKPKPEEAEAARTAHAAMAKQMSTGDAWPASTAGTTDPSFPPINPTAEDLLKQRFLHAQKRAPGSSLMMGGSGTSKDVPSFFQERGEPLKDEDTSLMGKPPPPPTETTEPPAAPEQDPLPDTEQLPPLPADKELVLAEGPQDSFSLPRFHANYLQYEQPFNTHMFVRRLEAGGWVRDAAIVTPPTHRHDPAEAIMDLTRSLLKERGEEITNGFIDKSDLDNQLYLFSSALSELRTEVRVRARNDAAALRSLTSLLQREVDGLSQKLQAEMERLKHDIQVDMNHRKTEVKEENNNLELEIQDLNNRFTIFLSDLKTEIEQSIKWDATRRALALVFGIVAIVVSTLALGDYLSRPDVAGPTPKAKEADVPPLPRAPPVPVGHDVPELPPKSAEEYGLLPRYESEEARYV